MTINFSHNQHAYTPITTTQHNKCSCSESTPADSNNATIIAKQDKDKNLFLRLLPDIHCNIISFLETKDKVNLTKVSKYFSPITTSSNIGNINTSQYNPLSDRLNMITLYNEAQQQAQCWISNRKNNLPLINKLYDLLHIIHNEIEIPEKLFKSVLQNSSIENTLDLTETITNEFDKRFFLEKISKIKLTTDQVDQVLSITETITSDYDKSYALQAISKIKLTTDQVDRALSITETITSKFYKSLALRAIQASIHDNNYACCSIM